MTGETKLDTLLKSMKPHCNEGDYVFCTVMDFGEINLNRVLMFFREEEAITVIIKKELADNLHLSYSFVASWISLEVHSSLEAVGLTAAFSNALAAGGISCNVVAAFYHDHIFVAKNDREKAMKILESLSEQLL
jgi:hypothetical protein